MPRLYYYDVILMYAACSTFGCEADNFRLMLRQAAQAVSLQQVLGTDDLSRLQLRHEARLTVER